MTTNEQADWAAQQMRYLQEKQKIVDEEHLRLLVIAHYIFGAIIAVYSCLFLLYAAMGLFMSHAPGMFPPPTPMPHGSHTPAAPEPDPRYLGYFFAAFGIIAVVMGWTFAALTFFAGRCIARRSSYTFSLVIAGLHCLMLPIGTALGVATFIVLLRPSVSDLFGVPRRAAPYPPSPPPGVESPPAA